MITIAEAREFLVKNAKKGCHCPCCERFFKIYRWPLNATKAKCLIGLVLVYERMNTWVHVRDIPLKDLEKIGKPGKVKKIGDKDVRVAGGDLAKLVHWGLIEAKRNKDTSKRASGMWRPTQRGIEFVYGDIKVPSHIYLNRNKLLKVEPVEIDISWSLKVPFNYQAIMNWYKTR